MGLRSVKGASLILIVLFVAIFALFVPPVRRYLYLTHQRLGYFLGFNFNDIATENYIRFTKSQNGELDKNHQAIFLNRQVKFQDAVAYSRPDILGETTAQGEKLIEVDISDQKLYMKEGDRNVASFLVSTGKWSPTPTGEWRIWTKLRYARMKGGSKALGTFYDLPNVPYTMYYNQGYGVHGAYWHSNFGQPMSHGCVNMKPEEAGIVFNWADVGTRVIVHQ